MNIAIVGAGLLPIPPTGYGAIEKHIDQLAGTLARGHDVHVVNRVVGSEYRFIPWALEELRRIDPDVIHTHTSAVGAALSHLRQPVVYSCHNPAWTAHRLDPMSRWGLFLDRGIARRASAFIATDPRTHERVRAYGARNLHLIHGAIDASRWKASSLDGGFALSVGKIERKKGYHEVLEGNGFRYVVAGKSVGEREYEDRLRGQGVELRLNPSNEEIRSLLERASVYVHPSRFDAFSVAVLEAMASGLPIVASPVSRDQVVRGVNGFLVSNGAYAAHVKNLLRGGDLHSFGQASRQLVEERFSWKITAKKILSVYRSVMR